MREAVFLLGARNVVHRQQRADRRQDVRCEAQEVLRDVQVAGGGPTERAGGGGGRRARAGAALVRPGDGERPRLNAFAFGRGKLQGLRCLQGGGWLLRFLGRHVPRQDQR